MARKTNKIGETTRDDGQPHTAAAPLPRTPAGFTGTRRSNHPDGNGYAVLVYLDGEVVEIQLHDATGTVLQRVYADDGAMPTTHAQARHVWPAGGDEPPPGAGS